MSSNWITPWPGNGLYETLILEVSSCDLAKGFILGFRVHLCCLSFSYLFIFQLSVGLRYFSVWIGYLFFCWLEDTDSFSDLVVAINFFRFCLTVNLNDQIIQWFLLKCDRDVKCYFPFEYIYSLCLMLIENISLLFNVPEMGYVFNS